MNDKLHNILVTGYINQILLSLPAHTIAPIDIIRLCSLFCLDILKIFMYSATTIHLMEPSTKRQSKLCLNDHLLQINTNPRFWYIPNINHNAKTIPSIYYSSKSYDGIVFIKSEYYDLYLNMILFESGNINANNTDYYMLKCDSKVLPYDINTYNKYHGSHQFLYCGKKHGLIFESKGNLTKFKIKTIDFCKNEFFFENKHITKFWQYSDSFLYPKYLSMIYLENSDNIFVMKCQCPITFCSGYDKTQKKTEKVAKCAIFDLNKNEWKKIANFKCCKDANNEQIYRHEICYEKYNSNIIYAVSNKGHIGRYHFKKNKWETLNNQHFISYFNKHIVWMYDSNGICYGNGQYFGHFDVRDSYRKWTKMDNLIAKTNNILTSLQYMFL